MQDAIALRNVLFSILAKGGFAVRKWASSYSAVLSDTPENLCEKPYCFSERGEESIKVLGLKWNPGTDSFFWEVKPPSPSSTITKRQVLSFFAAIYDCNGYLSPIIIRMKIFLEQRKITYLSFNALSPTPRTILDFITGSSFSLHIVMLESANPCRIH